MLRITVELLPGGRESGKRVIATADIARVRNGTLSDYVVVLDGAVPGEVGERATVRSYPGWAGSVRDLVARCLAAGLNQGREVLPPRPAHPEVPVHVNDAGFRYVRLDMLPLDLLQRLGWKNGDTLSLCKDSQGGLTVRRA